jgi:iron complex outermembrane receptor protein
MKMQVSYVAHKSGLGRLGVLGLTVLLAWCGGNGVLADVVVDDAGRSLLSIKQLMEVEVYTISRVDERTDEAPGSVYVFSRETIQQRGYRSLGELLQTVPGFTVFHRDLQYVVGVRGLNANDNEKTTLLINGQNVNGVSEPDFLNGPINLDNVERVEVIVGPSSMFQPANTLAATVNVITKEVNGTEMHVATGNALPYSATYMTGKRWASDEFVSFSLTTEEKRGFKAWYNDPANAGQTNVGARAGELDWPSFFSVLKGQYGELSGQIIAYRTAWPELNIFRAPGTDGQSVDEFYTLFLKDDHNWSGDLASVVSVGISRKRKTRLDHSHSTNSGIEIAAAQWDATGETGLRYTGFDGHLIQSGVQAGYVHNYDTYATVNYPGYSVIGKTTMVDADSQSVGFYVDDQYRLTPWLKLVGGLREDYNTVLKNEQWYPGGRAAIILDPTDNLVSKLSYNRAVRMPTAVESPLNKAWGKGKSNAPPFATEAPNATRPEILSTYEWENVLYLGKVRLGATAYHQELEDYITWARPWTNVEDFQGNGVELSLQAQLDPRLQLWANGSWNDSRLDINRSEDPLAPNRLIGAPKYTANAGFDVGLLKRLTFSPAVRYFTDQMAQEGDATVTIGDRVYVDATLHWRSGVNGNKPAMDVSLSGYNITDNRDPVATQWLPVTYEPRGSTVVLALGVQF